MKTLYSRMARVLGLLILSGWLAVAVRATTFPQLALGGEYQCVLMVTNKTGAAWQGTALLRQGNNQAWSTAWAVNGVDRSGSTTFDISLAAGGTAKFILTGDASARAGYLLLAGKTGFSTTGIAVAFFYNAADLAGRLLDSVGTPAAPVAKAFVFPVEKTATVNTGLAFAPSGVITPFDIAVTLLNPTGAQVQRKIVPYTGQHASFFTQIFDGVPDGLLGQMLIQSQANIFLTVLRAEIAAGGLQLTAVPAEPLLTVQSPAFEEGETIPARHTCTGANLLPALNWTAMPIGTRSWAMIVDDPDAPGRTFDHWIVFNLPAETRQLGEGTVTASLPAGALQGARGNYSGPCPPAGPAHRYFFRLYALDATVNLPAGASRQQLEAAMVGHILRSAELMGLFGL